MRTDPIAEMLTHIRNALMRRQEQTTISYSRLKEQLLQILQREGYLQGYEVVGEKKKKEMVLQLKYLADGQSAITILKRASRLSRRMYCGYEALKPLRSGMGLRVLTTSKGILTDREAKEKKIGGEILLEVW